MLSDTEFRQLLHHLDRPWAGYRKVRKGVKKRIRRHMADLGCSTVEAYLFELAHRPGARADCEHGLRVTISRFFRDRKLWQALELRVLPGLIERFPAPIRIWSAGCACGEEPYSLAMVWEELGRPANPSERNHEPETTPHDPNPCRHTRAVAMAGRLHPEPGVGGR